MSTSFVPYLAFDGNCAEAMRFYADVFGATDLNIFTRADAPPGEVPPGPADQVMNASLTVNGGMLMAGDAIGPGFTGQQGVCVHHTAADKAEAERVFGRLAEGGAVQMPLEPVFWAEAFGIVKDRYGTHWMISGPAVPMG